MTIIMMTWLTRLRTRPILATTAAALRHGFSRNSCPGYNSDKLMKVSHAWMRLLSSHKENPDVRLDASISSLEVVQEIKSVDVQNEHKTVGGVDFFNEMKRRFLNFKNHKYLKEAEHFRNLAKFQSPKFMVIACVDSRVCPSNVLGFQPGEAFMIRNVANIVPPLEIGPTETNAALEFAVKTLEVESIFVIGHSNCAGIEALMSMEDGKKPCSFVEKWVDTAKVAKLIAKTDASGLSFDQQCKVCEKESINHSLLNLLTYPWIEERVRKDTISVHGGYYDFLNCTFEKWTLDFKRSIVGEDNNANKISAKDTELWR